MPEQLLLFDQEEHPVRMKANPVDVVALRTDLQALELAADQLRQLARAGKAVAGLADEVRDRMRTDTHQDADGTPRAARAHPQDEQSAHQPHQPGRGHSAPH